MEIVADAMRSTCNGPTAEMMAYRAESHRMQELVRQGSTRQQEPSVTEDARINEGPILHESRNSPAQDPSGRFADSRGTARFLDSKVSEHSCSVTSKNNEPACQNSCPTGIIS